VTGTEAKTDLGIPAGQPLGLRETCRESDYIARMGGDEFVIVMPGLNSDTFMAQSSRFWSVPEEARLDCPSPVGEQLHRLRAACLRRVTKAGQRFIFDCGARSREPVHGLASDAHDLAG